MASEELTYIIALSILHHYYAPKVRTLIEGYGSAEAAWNRAEGSYRPEILERAKREIAFIDKHHLQTYYYRDENYPYRLRECPDAPVLLFGKGNLKLNEGKFLSVVGTRAATERGKEATHRLILDLARLVPDVTIVSGLAYGIDVAAHRAALEAGLPTIIVPAHGLDRIYPSLHRPVAVAALENGGILTEYPSGTEPEKGNFLARNRIVAGLADAVVVTESKLKGGSLVTAGIARSYNRDVFTMPGRPTDVSSQGCNKLIKNNQAALIDSAEDLVQAMMWEPATRQDNVQTEMEGLFSDMDENEKRLLQLIRRAEEGLHVNQLVAEAQISYAETATALMMLEMNGFVRMLPGNIYRAMR